MNFLFDKPTILLYIIEITENNGVQMQVGNLCRVIRQNTHKPNQYRDLVTIVEIHGNLVYAYNIKLNNTHHYWTRDLEVLCK